MARRSIGNPLIFRCRPAGEGAVRRKSKLTSTQKPESALRILEEAQSQKMLTLITGGARSGKSRFAQSLCASAGRVVYVATAVQTDDEMAARIARHQSARPPEWLTVEEPLEVPGAVAKRIAESDVLLIDCVTIWLSNLMYEWREEDRWRREQQTGERVEQLIEVSTRGRVIAVTNEVGSGIVPATPLGREFRDLQGFVNQKIAAAADRVFLVVSGIPVCVKPSREVGQ